MTCYRRLLNISYKDHATNEEACSKIQDTIECVMISEPRWKLTTYGMVTSQDPLTWRRQSCKDQWKELEVEEDKKRWEVNIKEWTNWELEFTCG